MFSVLSVSSSDVSVSQCVLAGPTCQRMSSSWCASVRLCLDVSQLAAVNLNVTLFKQEVPVSAATSSNPVNGYSMCWWGFSPLKSCSRGGAGTAAGAARTCWWRRWRWTDTDPAERMAFKNQSLRFYCTSKMLSRVRNTNENAFLHDTSHKTETST